ncbi:MAG: hypothetical protein KGQ59_12270, partial [Bdellovibrionales bacterium]|nr:hypothetical protein [Bdellovibrionales bacterium]
EEGFSDEIFQGMNQNRQRYGGVLLSQGELDEIREQKSIHWARVLNSKRELVGYGGFGKGIDLGRQLHEWGGAAEAVQVLARWALSLDSEAEIMGTQTLLEGLFGELPPETLIEPLCLAKIFDPELEAYLRSREDHLWFWGIDGV